MNMNIKDGLATSISEYSGREIIVTSDELGKCSESEIKVFQTIILAIKLT